MFSAAPPTAAGVTSVTNSNQLGEDQRAEPETERSRQRPGRAEWVTRTAPVPARPSASRRPHGTEQATRRAGRAAGTGDQAGDQGHDQRGRTRSAGPAPHPHRERRRAAAQRGRNFRRRRAATRVERYSFAIGWSSGTAATSYRRRRPGRQRAVHQSGPTSGPARSAAARVEAELGSVAATSPLPGSNGMTPPSSANRCGPRSGRCVTRVHAAAGRPQTRSWSSIGAIGPAREPDQ
jgi:hypothetical protein